MKLTKCHACYSGYGCKPEEYTQEEKNRLSGFLEKWGKYIHYYIFAEPTLCDVQSSLKRINLPAFAELEKYAKELELLREYCDDDGNTIYISEAGRLSWFWECDSDYAASSGIMDFEYTAEAAGNTWAYSEVVSCVRHFYAIERDIVWDEFTMPDDIKDDITLLQHLTQFLK